MPIRNVQREIREMLSTIAEKMNCEYGLVEDIYVHEFEYVAHQLTIGEKGNPETFENILLKHFGSFISNEKYIRKLKELQDERERNKEIADCL